MEGLAVTSNGQRLDAAFRQSLALAEDFDLRQEAYGRINEWDSVAHMQLITAIENAFGILIETDDVIAMSDYGVVVEILRTRYDVDTAS